MRNFLKNKKTRKVLKTIFGAVVLITASTADTAEASGWSSINPRADIHARSLRRAFVFRQFIFTRRQIAITIVNKLREIRHETR